MIFHSFLSPTDSVFWACGEERKKEPNYCSELPIARLNTQTTLALSISYLQHFSFKPMSTSHLHNHNRYIHTLFLNYWSHLFKSNTSLTCQLPLFILKSTTLLSVSMHCTHAECSTVPSTFTVSICPFTDSVLGRAPLDVQTLTVEREMRICNNIMGNKKKHYEHAINVWKAESLKNTDSISRRYVCKVPLQLYFHHFQMV